MAKSPKPTVTKGKIKPKTGMAGLYGGLGPNAYVNQLYAPQEKALADQQAARQATLRGLVSDYLASLRGVSSELAPYTTAAGQQTANANEAAASLRAANPNAVTQADLAAINAPQTQRDQVQGINNTAFGGNAALLERAGGEIPADQFRADAAAHASYLAALPAIAESIGVRGLSGLSNLASKENLSLGSDKIQSLQKARTDLADFVGARQKAKADAAKLAFDQNLALAKYKTQVDQFNVKTDLSYKRLAQQAYQSDRSYGLSLKRYGLASKALQIRALAQDAKLHNGGFTPSQLNRFNTDAAFVVGQVGTAKERPTYDVAMQAMLERHVPLSIAKDALNKIYPETQRPIDAKTMGDYNQTVGLTSAGKAKDFASAARTFIGIPYSWGGGTPSGPTKGFAQGSNIVGYDCSSFVQAVYARLGISIPRTTQAQAKAGQPVQLGQLQPGDLIFTRPGVNGPNHVGLYIGNGKVQVSPHTGDVNKIISLGSYLSDGFVSARRYVG